MTAVFGQSICSPTWLAARRLVRTEAVRPRYLLRTASGAVTSSEVMQFPSAVMLVMSWLRAVSRKRSDSAGVVLSLASETP